MECLNRCDRLSTAEEGVNESLEVQALEHPYCCSYWYRYCVQWEKSRNSQYICSAQNQCVRQRLPTIFKRSIRRTVPFLQLISLMKLVRVLYSWHSGSPGQLYVPLSSFVAALSPASYSFLYISHLPPRLLLRLRLPLSCRIL